MEGLRGFRLRHRTGSAKFATLSEPFGLPSGDARIGEQFHLEMAPIVGRAEKHFDYDRRDVLRPGVVGMGEAVGFEFAIVFGVHAKGPSGDGNALLGGYFARPLNSLGAVENVPPARGGIHLGEQRDQQHQTEDRGRKRQQEPLHPKPSPMAALALCLWGRPPACVGLSGRLCVDDCRSPAA